MRKDFRVCVVLPAYNEELVIKDVIEKISQDFKRARVEHTTIVVDDGSIDSTADKAREAGAIVIKHILNSGAGGATATGLVYAHEQNFDLAVTMDADGQHLPKDALKGIKLSRDTTYDLLIGSRLINSKGMSRIKVIGNKGLSMITRILFGVNATDSQSGLRIYSKKALENLRWKADGYEFCSEMLWRAKRQHMSVHEYPITAVYTEYSKSKGQNNWNAINIIKSLIRNRLSEIFE